MVAVGDALPDDDVYNPDEIDAGTMRIELADESARIPLNNAIRFTRTMQSEFGRPGIEPILDFIEYEKTKSEFIKSEDQDGENENIHKMIIRHDSEDPDTIIYSENDGIHVQETPVEDEIQEEA